MCEDDVPLVAVFLLLVSVLFVVCMRGYISYMYATTPL